VRSKSRKSLHCPRTWLTSGSYTNVVYSASAEIHPCVGDLASHGCRPWGKMPSITGTALSRSLIIKPLGLSSSTRPCSTYVHTYSHNYIHHGALARRARTGRFRSTSQGCAKARCARARYVCPATPPALCCDSVRTDCSHYRDRTLPRS